MSTIEEIEAAITRLSPQQLEELVIWLDKHRSRRVDPAVAEAWLAQARGAARYGVTTAEVKALSRS